jgi:DNA-binding CsgD family transcriptional regulator
MRPSTRELITAVAARHGITIEQILAHHQPKRLLAVRIEIAKALAERGYSGRQIGAAMNRNYTTAYYYLGWLKKQPRPRPPKPAKVRYAGWDGER